MKRIKFLILTLLIVVSTSSFALADQWTYMTYIQALKIQLQQVEQYTKQLEDLKMQISNFEKLPLEALSYSKQGKELLALFQEIAEIQRTSKAVLLNVKNFENDWDKTFPDASKLNDNFQGQIQSMLDGASSMNKMAMKQNGINFSKNANDAQALQELLNQTKTPVGMQQAVQTSNTILIKLGEQLNRINSSISTQNLQDQWTKQQEIEERKQAQAQAEKALKNTQDSIDKAKKRANKK